MSKKIAILRGINVGGKRKILMTDLKKLCENLAFKHVKTYIQSGNIIFNSDEPIPVLAKNLEEAIQAQFGFDVPVIIITQNELETTINNNPFIGKDAAINQLHVTFLKEEPTNTAVTKALTYNYPPDEFKITGKTVFIFCIDKYHKSKLSNNFFEKQLAVKATTRNWKTVMKLLEISKA